MEKEEIVILKDIRDTLKIVLETINKQPSKIEKIFNSVMAIIGILGILTIIDVVLSWIK